MDRKMIYPGQIPLETDVLDTNRFAMIGLGKLAAAALGTSTLVNGLACTPTAPTSMQVQVAPGEIYSLQNLDSTAYSSLSADTTHQFLKQGLLMDALTLSCPAPATSGQSINYLVQAAYQDVDTNAVVLPYYNASNPPQAYAGPNNSGTSQNTVRKGVCAVSLKIGIAATTGTQLTPAADAGCTALFVVTVAYGQTAITAANISTASGAPFVNSTLLGLAPSFTTIPTSPTPAQFDNSTNSATTAFVQRAIGNRSGYVIFNTNQILGNSAFGGVFESSGSSSLTCQLPSVAACPGGVITLYNAQSGNALTVSSALGSFYGPNNSVGTSTFVLQPGVSVDFVSDGANWKVVNGAGMALKTSSGYIKFPGGIIIQWGFVVSSASSVAVSFPIAFPNVLLACTPQLREQSSGNYPTSIFASSASATGCFTLVLGGYTSGTTQANYIAIGY
ncbi:hypothetical protein [Xanthomonas sp. MUS 060]|uniref:gp53-like domain-containing protein n=1 Tax=Xanthomonas sp. MUS 060 TaxID=1588031 RepID=UPI000A4E5596|nr:hypothetical protein [Xanthomonas sp. MUS 060]